MDQGSHHDVAGGVVGYACQQLDVLLAFAVGSERRHDLVHDAANGRVKPPTVRKMGGDPKPSDLSASGGVVGVEHVSWDAATVGYLLAHDR